MVFFCIAIPDVFTTGGEGFLICTVILGAFLPDLGEAEGLMLGWSEIPLA